MFKIYLHALWSRDYAVALHKLFMDFCGYSSEEAKQIFVDLTLGKGTEILCETAGMAYDLCTDLLQFGVFAECEQVGEVTPQAIAMDTIRLLQDDISMFQVLLDETGKPVKLVEKVTMGMVTFEDPAVMDIVGRHMLAHGSEAIDQAKMDLINAKVESLRQERITYARAMTEKYGRDWKRILWLERQGSDSEEE